MPYRACWLPPTTTLWWGLRKVAATPPPVVRPPSAPLFDENGTLSRAWWWYWYQVFTSAQSLNDTAVLEAFDAGAGGQGPGSSKAERLLAFEGAGPGLLRELAQLRALVAAIGETPAGPAKFDDLKKLIWMLADGRPPKALYTGIHAHRLATYPLSGAFFFETDTGLLFVAVLGVWTAISAAGVPLGAWTAFTTTITPGAGGWTANSQDCAYQQIGKTIFLRVRFTGTPTGGPTDRITFSLPVASLGTLRYALAATHDVGTGPQGNACQINGANSALLFLVPYGNFALVAQDIYITGMYEAA